MLKDKLMPDGNQIFPGLLLIGGLGVAWLIVRSVFKIAMRSFLIGCAGILFVGLFAYLVVSNLAGS